MYTNTYEQLLIDFGENHGKSWIVLTPSLVSTLKARLPGPVRRCPKRWDVRSVAHFNRDFLSFNRDFDDLNSYSVT